jgi:hypothetical protein
MHTWIRHPFEVLTPEDWFGRGHEHFGGRRDKKNFWFVDTKPGIFIWAPPPGAAMVAVEELRKSVLKRQTSTHVFICPRLLTTEWRKQLNKTCDLVLFLNAGADEDGWPKGMYEPLTIGFVFPFLSCKPWQRRGTPKMFYLARKMLAVREGEKLATRNFLRQLFDEQQSLTELPELLVRRLLYFSK